MTGHGYDAEIVDSARGHALAPAERAVVDAHLAGCQRCAALLERERRLSGVLRDLGEATAGSGASAALEARLLQSFAAMHGPGTARRAQEWRSWVGVAAAIVLVAGIAFAWLGILGARPAVDDRARSASVRQSYTPGDFVPWPGAAALPAFESGQLVRMELPASVLPMLGIVPAMDISGASVTADVLVGQDGLARAVRLAQD